jgi:Xaa-Pro dipeptidase
MMRFAAPGVRSTSGLAPPFSAEEYDARLGNVRQAMGERGIGAMLVASPEDIYYLVGLDHLGHFAFTLLVVPLEGAPALVAREMERSTVELQTPGCTYVPYRDDEDPAAAVISTVRGLESPGGSVGVQLATMALPVDIWERVRSHLPGVRWTDASELVGRARLVKSSTELAYMRRAAAISDRALRAGHEVAGEGVTERQVAAAVYAELIAAGSEPPAIAPLVRSTPTLKFEHFTWSDRPLARGDTLFVELSACVARYHAPLSRMAHAGASPAGLDEAVAPSLAGLEAICGAMRPGATADEVYQAWQGAVRERLGNPRYRRHHCGYVIGIGYPPSWSGTSVPVGLRAGHDLVLREGMAFHIFSWILGQGPTDYGVSDTAVVTSDGCELFTTTTREPSIVRAARSGQAWTGGW